MDYFETMTDVQIGGHVFTHRTIKYECMKLSKLINHLEYLTYSVMCMMDGQKKTFPDLRLGDSF